MDMLALAPITGNFTKAGFAAGTTSTVTTTATLQYAIAGKSYSKAAITNQATPTTDYATGLAFPALSANQGTLVLVGFDAAGTLRAVQGSIVALDASGAFTYQAPTMPPIVDNFCPFGYVVLKAGATLAGTFTFGVNNLSGVTGMTYTFVDVAGVVARPQVA